MRNPRSRPQVLISVAFGQSLLLVWLFAATSAAIAVVASPKSPDEGILWLDLNQESVWFVPAALIEAYPLADLPLSADQGEALRWRLEDWPPKSDRPFNASGVVNICTGRGSTQFPYPIPEATNLEGMIKNTEVAFVGTIIAEEPGWDAWRKEVAYRLTVQLERALKPLDLPLGEVSVIRYGGSMTIRGKQVCTDINPWFHQPQPGERILALGAFSPSVRRAAIDLHFSFVIREGQIEPEPYPSLRDRQPMSLEELVMAFPSGE